MKLSNLFAKIKIPRIFQATTYKDNRRSLLRVWKKFIRQSPREFRSVIKSHQHFILLGDDKSGKSEMVRSIVEQSQNIYPFEVEFVDDKDLQFYLGPKQIIQELSLDLIKDRTIKLRRSIIQLWKRLFVKGPPIVVIAYNCWLESSMDIREVNKSARLIAGKLALLSELSKAPLRVRIALTHLDKVEGYLEFARFIKQHNIAFEISLTSNFESEALVQTLSEFRDEYLSLILTTASANDYIKILSFFTNLPNLFPTVEEFLRILITGNGGKSLELESLTFTSNFEPYTSFASFNWDPDASRSIFYRHPMLKHQIGAAAILLICFGLVFNNFFKDQRQITLSREGIDSLIFLQPKIFVEEVIPEIERVNKFRPREGYLPFLPRFYKKEIKKTNQILSTRIRKHILEQSLRKLMLQDESELKVIYMLGLIHATNENRLGQHILKNLHDWAHMLAIDESLIKAYILSSYQLNNRPIEIEHLDKINVSTPLSDTASWLSFLARFQEIIDQPVFTGHGFNELREDANYLLNQFRKIKEDKHSFVISNLLRETSSRMLSDFDKNMKSLKWIEENSDLLESFLVFVCQSCPQIPDVSKLNVSQFFVKLKEISALTLRENRSYHFLLGDQVFLYETRKWINLSTTHVIERLIHSYILANNDTQGNIFFNNTPDISGVAFESYRSEFPFFVDPVVIDGRFTRMAFEKNVRNTTESLLKLLEEMPIIEEERDRFKKFVQQEIVGYAKEYQENYERLYAACDIRTSNLEEIKDILGKILLPSSYFEHFLNTMTHHTAVFSDPTTCLNVLDEMNHFTFLQPLMSQAKNKLSPFKGYQKFIQEALAELNSEKEPFGGIDTLDKHLTPAACITLSILRNDPNSYLNLIVENLIKMGVPTDYHSIFVAPIMQVYDIGIKDLKKGICALWEESLQPQLDRLFEKRPFNPGGAFAATFDEVEKLTSPTSEFFGIIKEIMTPVSHSFQGLWHPNSSSTLQLDREIYESVNRLAKISQILWDNEGNPQPIQLTIQSLPFEAQEKLYPAPIVSYLVTGEETFHNFNQRPVWHQIKLDWWKENSSTVVMELSNKNDSRSYRDEKVTNTIWSFFELLKKANPGGNNVWKWELASQFGEDASRVALQFETDPWGLFQHAE